MQATPEQIREFLRQYVSDDTQYAHKGLLASAYRFFTGKDTPVTADTVEALASITGATAYGWDLAAAVESVLETAFGTEALEVVAVYLAYLLGVVPVPWEEE